MKSPSLSDTAAQVFMKYPTAEVSWNDALAKCKNWYLKLFAYYIKKHLHRFQILQWRIRSWRDSGPGYKTLYQWLCVDGRLCSRKIFERYRQEYVSRRRHKVRVSNHTHTFIQFSLLLFSDSSRLIVMVIRLAISCSFQTAIRSLDFSRKAH